MAYDKQSIIILPRSVCNWMELGPLVSKQKYIHEDFPPPPHRNYRQLLRYSFGREVSKLDLFLHKPCQTLLV